jgi:hypothetical protein
VLARRVVSADQSGGGIGDQDFFACGTDGGDLGRPVCLACGESPNPSAGWIEDLDPVSGPDVYAPFRTRRDTPCLRRHSEGSKLFSFGCQNLHFIVAQREDVVARATGDVRE